MPPDHPTSEERFIGGIAHIAVLFSALGLALNIALLVAQRGRSRFAIDHLKQAVGLQSLSIILSWTLGLYVALSGFRFGYGGRLGHHLFFYRVVETGLLLLALNAVKLVLAVVGAVKALGGHPYRQPLIGDLIARVGE